MIADTMLSGRVSITSGSSLGHTCMSYCFSLFAVAYRYINLSSYFVTVTGDESERIETMSDAAVQEEIMEVLQMMYPKITVPEPTSIMFPRWHSDPLYRGSFSNWPPR